VPDWTAIGRQGHAVQFFNDDACLLDLLTRYVGTALVAGDAALVIATRAHRDLLAVGLKARGFDIGVARKDRRYVALDAAETLSRITDAGWPNETQFTRVVGGALERLSAAAGPGACVAVFGELIAILSTAGRSDAAIRLEELWNQLGRSHAFSLCCGYPMSAFSDQQAGRFLKICGQHSHVFPAGPTLASRSELNLREQVAT
jgi:hypothetical protein